MALRREGFYCMYFSQQESGQSTLCEHLIGLTAGEEEEEEWRERQNPKEERKQRHGRKVWVTRILNLLCLMLINLSAGWLYILCIRVKINNFPVTSHLHTVFISVHPNSDQECVPVAWAKMCQAWVCWQVTFSLKHQWYYYYLKKKQAEIMEREAVLFCFRILKKYTAHYLPPTCEAVCVFWMRPCFVCVCLGKCGCWQVSLSVLCQ